MFSPGTGKDAVNWYGSVVTRDRFLHRSADFSNTNAGVIFHTVAMERQNYSSGSSLEASTGYSRMVRLGDTLHVGGTTSVTPEGTVAGETVYDQTVFILNKCLTLMAAAGFTAGDVYKVKGYLTDMTKAGEAARAYSEVFRAVKPLFTLVGIQALNRPTQLVELELEAHRGCTAVPQGN